MVRPAPSFPFGGNMAIGLDQIEICNDAIGLCGSTQFIQSLGDPDSVASLRCDRYFIPAVKRVLRRHNWFCATHFVELAQNTTAPTGEFDYAYALPPDCVRINKVFANKDGYSPYDRWQPYKRNIHTNIGKLYLKYVQMPEDYRELDVLLADAIAYELAVKLAPTLLKDKRQYAILKQASKVALADAKAIDTLEAKDLYVENDVYNDYREIVGSHTSSWGAGS